MKIQNAPLLLKSFVNVYFKIINKRSALSQHTLSLFVVPRMILYDEGEMKNFVVTFETTL